MTKQELDFHVEKYLNGEIESFNVIYEETKKSVYLSIWSIFRNNSICEDLMQDTYIKALNSLSSYKLGTNFSAWISKIAHNIAINHYHKNSKSPLVNDEEFAIIDDSPSNTLKDALRILEGNEKEIVIYHIILNYTFKDISEIMNIKPSTVFWIYKEALRKIKQKL